ncbi:MAG: P-loop NTPase fold protein [Clostridium perfringens]|nr:P-loop NTPase fold protein [Clostridium perfringens]
MRNFLNDTASEYDYLGYKPYIEAFNYILKENNKLITPPLVFGIHGKWGEGKTTFMNLICKRIEKDFYTININPWEYGDNKKFITIFLAKLYEKVKSEKLKLNKSAKADFIKTIFKPLKISLGFSSIKAEYDFDKFSQKQQEETIDSIINENFALKESINQILGNEIFNKKKIVIFIDDLDRCDVDKVMEVIESIKLVLNSKNCIFFLGCDITYIESALANKYKGIIQISKEEYWKEFSREYLEKIIQIPFYIPKSDTESIEKYIESIIFNSKKDERKINIKNDFFKEFQNDLQKKFIMKLIDYTKVNPRRIKRIMNLSFLNYVFLKFKNINGLKVDTNLLVLLCIIREVYPEYYKKYLSYKQTCIKIFNTSFELYKKEDDESLSNRESNDKFNEKEKYEEVFKLLELYFEYQKLNSKKAINEKLNNIEIYINVNNISSSEEYDLSEWGEIANIKSEITGRKLKVFLEQIKDNKNAKEVIFWFFDSLYNELKEKIKLGIVKNVQVYDKENDIWLFRFDYDTKLNELGILFFWRKNNSGFIGLNKNINYKGFTNNKILINDKLTESDIETIKLDIENIFNIYFNKS